MGFHSSGFGGKRSFLDSRHTDVTGSSLETFLPEPRPPLPLLVKGRRAQSSRRGLGAGAPASGAPLGSPADAGDPRFNDLTCQMTEPAA